MWNQRSSPRAPGARPETVPKVVGGLPRLCLVLALGAALGAQAGYSDKLPVVTPLSLLPTDVRIENSNDGGYVLYVRAKPGIKSILITESTEPGNHKQATYTLRSLAPHPFNADQKRILNGKPIEQLGLHFLVSSSPVADPAYGEAFRLFLPYVLEYGFPDSRNGRVALLSGTFLSIRSFARPWADYAGAYQDNPYRLVLNQLPPRVESGAYNQEAFKVFERIAFASEVSLRRVEAGKDLASQIAAVVEQAPPGSLDLVLCLDATGSMEPYREFVWKELSPLLQSYLPGHGGSRFAFVEYKDYYEEFIYRVSPFTADFKVLEHALGRYRPRAGGDVPEAVDEALMGALRELDWQAPQRLIILVGDAPPHPLPLGKVSHQAVLDTAREMGVSIIPVILPADGKSALPSAEPAAR